MEMQDYDNMVSCIAVPATGVQVKSKRSIHHCCKACVGAGEDHFG
jgi:hypothetical protein